MKLFSVFDSKASTFCIPFVSQNDSTALRDFAHAASDRNLEIGKYPTDFSLFRIGSFDKTTGVVVPEATPVSLGVAASLINFEG
ncbi:MAG: nonstructural protein [Microviridae sp.]|nr:MAG: nonstructural protein [Microviridae sp.]